MQDNITFTIVIPCFNASRFINDAINSILCQNTNNLEIVIVDDYSNDDTLNIIKRIIIENSDVRIKVIQNQSNRGVSYSRNVGIKEAKGDFILFLDADDTYESNTFEYLSKTAKHNNELDIISFSILRDGGGLKRQKKYGRVELDDQVFSGFSFAKLFLSKRINQSICSVAIRQDMIKEHSIEFNQKVKLGEDLAFQIKCMVVARNIKYSSQAFFHYKFNPTSVTNRVYSEKHLTCIQNYDDVCLFLKKANQSELLPYLNFYYQYLFFYELRYFIKAKDNELLESYLNSDSILSQEKKSFFSKYCVILAALKTIYKISPNVLKFLLKV